MSERRDVPQLLGTASSEISVPDLQEDICDVNVPELRRLLVLRLLFRTCGSV